MKLERESDWQTFEQIYHYPNFPWVRDEKASGNSGPPCSVRMPAGRSEWAKKTDRFGA